MAGPTFEVCPGPDIRFEPQGPASYSGPVVFQHFFSLIGVGERLWGCFRHPETNPIYGRHVAMMLPVVHLIIGHRQLRDMDAYRDDGMVKRIPGPERLSDVSTVSCPLAGAGGQSVDKVQNESRRRVHGTLGARGVFEGDARLRRAGVGYRAPCRRNRNGFQQKRKGTRSHPLLRTIARTGQVPDVHHRPGNVHDSNGGRHTHQPPYRPSTPCLPHARIETRIDSAFPDETVVRQLHSSEAEFTASVPFERFPALKGLVESKKRWCRPADGIDCFETRWKPKSRNARRRLIPTGNQVGRQLRSPFRIGPFRLIGSGAHSGSSPPTGEWARVRSLPSMRAGGRRSVSLPGPGRIAERIAYRSGDPDRQPTAHVRWHPRPQPHPRAPDPDRCPRPRHTPKRAAVRHFRGTETLRRTPVRCTGRIIRPGGKPIPSMNGHDGRDGEHPTYPSIPNAAA